MFEVLRKSLLGGMALASLTKEKLDELGRDLARHAELSEEQTDQLLSDLQRRATTARQELQSQIDERIDHLMIQTGIMKAGLRTSSETMRHDIEAWIDQRINAALDRLHVARQEDLDSLQKQVEQLRQRLDTQDAT